MKRQTKYSTPGTVVQRVTMLVMTLLLMTSEQTRADVTCSAITTGASSTVMCYFGTDINKTKEQNFRVQFFPKDSDDEPEPTLTCNFHLSGVLICTEAPGVIFDGVASDQISLIRPPAVDKVGGQYLCQLVPALTSGAARPCNLTFQEKAVAVSAQSDSLGGENDSVVTYLKINMALVIMCLLVLIFALVVLPAILYITRERLCKWWTGRVQGSLRRGVRKQDPEQPHSHQDLSTLPEHHAGLEDAQSTQLKKATDAEGNKAEGDSEHVPLLPLSPQKEDPDTEVVPERPPLQSPSEEGKATYGFGVDGALWFLRDMLDIGMRDAGASETNETEEFHDTSSPPEKAETSCDEIIYRKSGLAQGKAMKKIGLKEKEQARRKAKEIVEKAALEAKRIRKEAKGKSKEERKEADERAERIISDAKCEAKLITGQPGSDVDGQ